ncbi:hypothetical protein [Cohnella panacarvi]|uniref:hypothetical protein n=1 Tax=Cohnella panacarvi TaxID=400776 RepID=UPI00047ED201|nr:hypothetical protein [Cohnella panacarvi]
MGEQTIRYVYEQKEGSNIAIKFNGLFFGSYEIDRFLEQSGSEDHYNEFLPGIYMKKDQKFFSRMDRAINKLDYRKREKPTIGLIFRLLYCRLVDKWLFEKQKVMITINIVNKRDSIEIVDEAKTLYTQRTPVFNPSQGEHDYTNDSIEFKWVDTSHILYPFRSGGDGNRCRIKGIFQTLNLLNGHRDNEYVFFSEHEMFVASAESIGLMEECKKFERCMDIYNRFNNNEYVQPDIEHWYDEIVLEEYNGQYRIANANHRVCIAKRFEVPSVYAKVYKYSEKKIAEPKRRSVVSGYGRHTRGNNKEILFSFYHTIGQLGINKETSQYILKEGLRGKDLVDFIERESGKSLYELARTSLNR